MSTLPVSTREQYRKKAELILAQAETIRHPQERAVLLSIAQAYLGLADWIRGRLERGTAPRSHGDQLPRNGS